MDNENKKKVNRLRDKTTVIRFTQDEKEILIERMKSCNIENFNSYALGMLLNGQIYNIDLSDIKEHTVSLNRIGNNINQIAHKFNSNDGNLKDIIELKELLRTLINGEKEIVKACRKINSIKTED